LVIVRRHIPAWSIWSAGVNIREVERVNIQPTKRQDAAGLLIALVDDDKLYNEYLSQLLNHQYGCRIFDADSSAAMVEILDHNPIDCVILDYNLGVESGLSIGELIKKKYPDPPPIIMLTGEAKERTVVKAFRGGFSDFVSKRNLNIEELIEAIRGAVDRKLVDRAEREERDRLVRLSTFDGMTGLRAIDFMKQRLDDLIGSVLRQRVSFGAILIRLHELEDIGDTFGYAIRDRALQAFASRLQKSTRGTDICGRYSEDSFIYLIDREASARSLTKFCERLSRDLSFEANFDKASFTFRAAIGAALFPEDGASVEQLMAAAELALVRARLSGVPFATAFPAHDDGVSAEEPAPSSAVSPDNALGGPSHLLVRREGDRRSERRQRVLKRGRIQLRGFDSVVDCMIRDLSSGGARIRVDDYYTPADEFDLVFVDSGERRPVKVRWRVGNDLGVQFLA
jgi:diguanylate cyclase (GGDEF)-like protein